MEEAFYEISAEMVSECEKRLWGMLGMAEWFEAWSDK